MKTNQNCLLPPVNIKRLHVQGYGGFSNQELTDFRFGIRFAYGLCVSLVTAGLILENILLLSAMMTIALFAIFLPYHPLDYIYNHIVRHPLKKAKLPRRTNQIKFACGIASIWLGGVIYLFQAGLSLWAQILGGALVFVAILVTTTDICIPSMIYNFLFKKESVKIPTSF